MIKFSAMLLALLFVTTSSSADDFSQTGFAHIRAAKDKIVHLDQSLQNGELNNSSFRRIVIALVKSGQCDPNTFKANESEVIVAYYACVFEYKKQEYIIFSKSNFSDNLLENVIANDYQQTIGDTPIYWLTTYDTSLKAEIQNVMKTVETSRLSRRQPQFRTSNPPKWSRLEMLEFLDAAAEFNKTIEQFFSPELIRETERLIKKYEFIE